MYFIAQSSARRHGVSTAVSHFTDGHTEAHASSEQHTGRSGIQNQAFWLPNSTLTSVLLQDINLLPMICCRQHFSKVATALFPPCLPGSLPQLPQQEGQSISSSYKPSKGWVASWTNRNAEKPTYVTSVARAQKATQSQRGSLLGSWLTEPWRHTVRKHRLHRTMCGCSGQQSGTPPCPGIHGGIRGYQPPAFTVPSWCQLEQAGPPTLNRFSGVQLFATPNLPKPQTPEQHKCYHFKLRHFGVACYIITTGTWPNFNETL